MMENMIISSDKSMLDVTKIHAQIKNSYWGGYRSLEQTKKTIKNSVCYGVYHEGEQIGFARVLTDEVVFAYLMDVMIFDGYQGMGLGKQLLEHILDSLKAKEILTIALKTKDAHSLYEKYGFKAVGDSNWWMAMDNAKYETACE